MKILNSILLLGLPGLANAGTFTIDMEFSLQSITMSGMGYGVVAPEQVQPLLDTGLCSVYAPNEIDCGGRFDLLAYDGLTSYDRIADGWLDTLSARVRIDDQLVGADLNSATALSQPVDLTCDGPDQVCDAFEFRSNGNVSFDGFDLFATSQKNGGDSQNLVERNGRGQGLYFVGYIDTYRGVSPFDASFEYSGLTFRDPGLGYFTAEYSLQSYSVLAPATVPLTSSGFLLLTSFLGFFGLMRRKAS